MKIAFFTSELSHPKGKKMGGLGNVAMEMLDYLSEIEDVEIYCFSASRDPEPKIHTNQEGNIKYHWIPDTLVNVNEKVNFNKYVLSLNTLIIHYLLKTYLSSNNQFFDIFHFHDWMTIRILLHLHTLNYPTTRRILHMHSSEFGRNGNKLVHHDSDSMYRHNLEMQGCHAADLVLAVAQVFKEELMENFNMNEQKIRVAHNGMNFSTWLPYNDENHDAIRNTLSIKKTDTVFLFCGRLVWQKNPKLLVDGFSLIAKKFPNSRLVFMGNGHMKEELEVISRQAGLLDSQIYFLGAVYGASKIKWYCSADCLVVPSFNEPFGLIFIEALICATPVLYPSNISANKFLTHKEHGLRFRPKPLDLAKAMISIIKDKPNAKKMGIVGKKYVEENFNERSMGETLYKEYKLINTLKINKIDETEHLYSFL